jgi:hypothetical protein
MTSCSNQNCPHCQRSIAVSGSRKLYECWHCGGLSYLNTRYQPFLKVITPFQGRLKGADKLMQQESLLINELPKLEESKVELVKSRKKQQKTRISTYRVLIMNILILIVTGFFLFSNEAFARYNSYLVMIYGVLVFAATVVMIFFIYQSVSSENTIAMLTSKILNRKKRLLILQGDLEKRFG